MELSPPQPAEAISGPRRLFRAVCRMVTNHPDKITGIVVCTVPVAVAWATTTPWVTGPVAAGSAVGSIFLAKAIKKSAGQPIIHRALDIAFHGVIKGAVYGLAAGGFTLATAVNFIHEHYYPRPPADIIRAQLDAPVCFKPGESFPLEYKGRQFIVTTGLEERTRVAGSLRNTLKTEAHHRRIASIPYSQHLITDKTREETVTVEGAERPGSYITASVRTVQQYGCPL